jgi:hypothetical protein
MSGEEKQKKGIRFIWISLIILVIILLLLIGFAFGYYMIGLSKESKTSTPSGKTSVVENPMKGIVLTESGVRNNLTNEQVIEEGVKNFDYHYINYILLALGVQELHEGIGFGNPVIQLDLNDESWNTEIIKSELKTQKGSIEKKDLLITLSKEEVVKALLSSDIKQFMKDSVTNGNIQISMVAGKVELFSKGYLEMYKKISGEEISI